MALLALHSVEIDRGLRAAASCSTKARARRSTRSGSPAWGWQTLRRRWAAPQRYATGWGRL